MTAAQSLMVGVIWLAGANGLFLLISPILAPAAYVKYTEAGLGARTFGGDRWWGMPFGLFSLISLGRVLYCALYSVTFVVPADLGSPDQEGDWQSARSAIALFLAAVATIPVMLALDNAARALLDRSRA